MEGIKISITTLRDAHSENGGVPRTERDIPIMLGILGVIACLLLLYTFVMHFVLVQKLYTVLSQWILIWASLATIVYILVIGFSWRRFALILTGLVGSSNNPLSGILILSILIFGCAVLFCIFLNIQMEKFPR